MNKSDELGAELTDILGDVRREVAKAVGKHGDQMDVPLGFSSQYAGAAEEAKESTDRAFLQGRLTWMHIAAEEALETFAEEDPIKARAEALQAAAMFVQIVRRCDREIDLAKPLLAGQRVLDDEYGPGAVDSVQPDSELGPIAWIRWDRGRGVKAYDLGWAKRLERIDAGS